MAGRGEGPEFVEALARGLDVLACFSADHPQMTLRQVAEATGLARPTARRLLLTLAELGYVRGGDGSFALTPRVLDLGMAYIGALGLWDVARPHLEELVAHTQESSSMSTLEGSDIVYVARVAVPKIITLRVQIGTRFPAVVTSQGKVHLAALDDDQLGAVLARGWALADEELAPGVRSIAAPVRGRDGGVAAAMNVTVHAAETSVEVLVEKHLPWLLRAASAVSADWALWQSRPQAELAATVAHPSPA
jgi:IclR family pca regulon transcriptional regulator